jgi:endonuclease/exonuclease/phosphatase family metal-dependent hydrolase
MKIATWTVNGIRARLAQLQQWVAQERPDVVCLQEIKASADQIPTALCEMEGYWCYWHGEKGYSGVAIHVSKHLTPERPAFSHPPFDYENRIVLVALPGVSVASVYVPNGGKDFPAKMRFLGALELFAAGLHAETSPIVLCGDMNIARTDRTRPGGRRPRARSRQRSDVHLVGAVAEHAAAEHRLAARLLPRQPLRLRHRPLVRRPTRCRHERSRSCCRRLRSLLNLPTLPRLPTLGLATLPTLRDWTPNFGNFGNPGNFGNIP